MSRIRGLELLFNLEKKNFKCKEDCLVAVFHCLLINENFQCVGIGDEWPEIVSSTTELLPSDWNNNQDVYSLRYISKDLKSRILLKLIKMEHILQVDVIKNEDAVECMSVPINNHVDNYNEYSTAYKDLDSLSESFRKNILEKFEPKENKESSAKKSSPVKVIPGSSASNVPQRKPTNFQEERNPYSGYPRFPRVGGSDLDPFGGSGGGGMFMDPSGFGIPARPSLSDFGVGSPGGLPRGAVPPGARFDPIRPPYPSGRFDPDADHFRPPNFDDDGIL